MINTNELRQGNIITSKNFPKPRPVAVSEIRKRNIITMDGAFQFGVFNEDAEGWEITANLLKAAGFFYRESPLRDWYKRIADPGSILILKPTSFQQYMAKVCASNARAVKIKTVSFVHELQNLHFSFTGEELKFTLNDLQTV